VAFSGGKHLRGPQATGILCGRRDLILSAALQHQDMDVFPETWPLRSLIAEGVIAGPPHHGIGRGFKVGKEEVVGLMVALKLYLERDHAADQARWRAMVDQLAAALSELPGVRVECEYPPATNAPALRLRLDKDRLGLTALDAVNRLAEGSPMVLVRQGQAHQGILGIQPMCLREEDLGVVIDRTRAVLGGGR